MEACSNCMRYHKAVFIQKEAIPYWIILRATIFLELKYVYHIEGLVQDSSNATVNSLELLLSCTKPSTWLHMRHIKAGHNYNNIDRSLNVLYTASTLKSGGYFVEL